MPGGLSLDWLLNPQITAVPARTPARKPSWQAESLLHVSFASFSADFIGRVIRFLSHTKSIATTSLISIDGTVSVRLPEVSRT